MCRLRTLTGRLAAITGIVAAVTQLPALQVNAASRPAPSRPPTVDLALTGSAVADTAGADHAAAAAIDGNAATPWCPATASGVLTMDLTRSHRLSGFGLTLLGDGPATMTIETATAPGRFHVARREASV